MPQNNIPGLGADLGNWRVRQGQTHDQWGDAIFQAGFTQWGAPGTVCDPGALAQGLATIETTDTWPLGDFVVEAPSFLLACKAALVHDVNDRGDLRTVVLRCAPRLFLWLNITGLFP